MWTYEHTLQTEAPAGAIWRPWADVSTWSRWDDDIRRANEGELGEDHAPSSRRGLGVRGWSRRTERIAGRATPIGQNSCAMSFFWRDHASVGTTSLMIQSRAAQATAPSQRPVAPIVQ